MHLLHILLSLNRSCFVDQTDAVRRNSVTSRAVDTEIQKAMKDWLRFAADRDGGRQRRAARKLLSQQQIPQRSADN